MNYHSLPVTHVSHVALFVSEIERSLVFYDQMLGFRILEQLDGRVSLTINGVDPVLTLYELKDVPILDRKASGMHHVAFLLPLRTDLAELYVHARKSGLLHEGVADHLVTESVYLSDPDGNGIEMYTDRDPADWMWNDRYVAMDTISLDANDLIRRAKKEWNGMPSGTIIGHIHLQVDHLERTAAFYTDYFSLDVVNTYGGKAAFLSNEYYHHHIGINTWNSAGRKSIQQPHIGMRFFVLRMTEENRQETKKKLLANAYSVEEVDEMFAVIDPAGNKVLF